jgi:hypothetical protein
MSDLDDNETKISTIIAPPTDEVAKEPEKGFSADFLDTLIEWLNFDNERIHRMRPAEPGDAARRTELASRLRGFVDRQPKARDLDRSKL